MGDGLKQGRAVDIVNAILLTVFMMLAVYAHFRCVTTNPGFLPKDYETLDEKNLSHRFYKLIQERESLHQSVLSRKFQREGKDPNEAEELAKQQSN